MEPSVDRISDLVTYQKELEQEELFLINFLAKIDKQIHALQVEQMHLVNVKNQAEINPINCNNMTITGDIEDPQDNEADKETSVENGHELDLRPIKKCDDSEEDEDEEEDDESDDKQKDPDFPNNSADFDYL